MYDKNILRTNLVSWLKYQASLSFVFDHSSQKHRVNEKIVPSRYPTFAVWSQSMRHIMAASTEASQISRNFTGCLMFSKWHELCSQNHHGVIDRIDETLSDWGYTDFEFLDHGGQAFAFRATYRPTGERRVVRVAAPHDSFMGGRPKHETIAQAYHSTAGADFNGIKVEVCDEYVPLPKLPGVKQHYLAASADDIFYRDLISLGQGTNLTYHQKMFDLDTDPQNIGLTPSGHIITFDPDITRGDEAMEMHRHLKTPYILKDASSMQLRLVYGQRSPT